MDFVSIIIGGIVAVASAWITARSQRLATKEQYEREIQEKRHERMFAYKEKEKAQRELVRQYAFSLISIIRRICQVKWLGDENKDEDDRRNLMTMKRYVLVDDLEWAHPQKNIGYQTAFLMFQFIGAFHLALLSRTQGHLTEEHLDFLEESTKRINSVYFANILPGKPWIYREHLEMISHIALTIDKNTNEVRPLNWIEFVESISDHTFSALVHQLRSKVYEVFDSKANLGHRLQTKTRFAFFGLYLIDLLDKETKEDSYIQTAAKVFWDNIVETYRSSPDQYRDLFVFQPGDIQKV